MNVVAELLTIDEYLRLPDDGRLTELVRGRVVEVSRPTPRHGQICSKVDRILGNFVEEAELGQTVINDAGVVTERDPDTVRGADVAYYSYETVPKGPFPAGYLSVPPDVAFEIKSEHDRWTKIVKQVGEFLDAGVKCVCVLDPDDPAIYVYSADAPVRILGPEDFLEFPDLIPGFRVQVRKFFE